MAKVYLKKTQVFPKLTKEGESQSMIFRPTTKEGVEKFSLWDVRNKKFINEKKLDGSPNILEIDGEEKLVNKYIKLSDEQKKLYGRNFSIERQIIYDGQEVTFQFTKTADEKLREAMENVENMGINPLEKFYVLTRSKVGKQDIDVEYKVTVSKEAPAPKISIKLDEDSDEANEFEMKLINYIKKNYTDYKERSEQNLAASFAEHGIEMTRAVTLVTKYLR